MLEDFNSVKKTSHLYFLDKLGITCSTVCMVHCFLVPLLALFSPMLGHYFENEIVHIFLLLIIMPVALTSFTRQRKIHGDFKPTALGVIGLTFLTIVIALDLSGYHLGVVEVILNSLGSLFLVSAHYINLRKIQLFQMIGQGV